MTTVLDRVRVRARGLARRPEVWQVRFARAESALIEAANRGLEPTPYFVEALAYWDRAKLLQDRNLGVPGSFEKSRDPLQDAIPIYDTVNRRYAGFSNVLEQLRYGKAAPKYVKNVAQKRDFPQFVGSDREWAYLCLVHRVTGSGASFEADHGWRNTVVPGLAGMILDVGYEEAQNLILCYRGPPIFTSIGNQIPAFNKKSDPRARLAGNEYLGLVAPKLVELFFNRRAVAEGVWTIQEAVDAALDIQRYLGWKQFKFVLTAWAMDLAEYLPHHVDPNSDCYHGKNAIEAMNACFIRSGRTRKFLDDATRLFSDLTGTHPMDVEDVAPGCDLIRWLENYVPRNGFAHVIEKRIFNSSSLYYPFGRQP